MDKRDAMSNAASRWESHIIMHGSNGGKYLHVSRYCVTAQYMKLLICVYSRVTEWTAIHSPLLCISLSKELAHCRISSGDCLHTHWSHGPPDIQYYINLLALSFPPSNFLSAVGYAIDMFVRPWPWSWSWRLWPWPRP